MTGKNILQIYKENPITTLADDDIVIVQDVSQNKTGGTLWFRFKALLADIFAGKKILDETITVGPGKDFATIQEAIDSLEGYVIANCTISIDVDVGSYDEAVTFDCFVCTGNGTVKLEGDTRENAGQTFTCTGNIVDNGDGTATITLASSPTSGWEDSSDRIIIKNCTTAGNEGEYTINSRGGAAITYTTGSVTDETVLSYTTVTLKPSHEITRTSEGQCILIDGTGGVEIDGWHLDTFTGANCNGVEVSGGGRVSCSGVSVESQDFGFSSKYSGNHIVCDAKCSAAGGLYGFFATSGGTIETIGIATGCNSGVVVLYGGAIVAQNSKVYGCIGSGFLSKFPGSSIDARWTTAIGCSYGFDARTSGSIDANYATAQICAIAYRAYYKSYIWATNTNANNHGNSTNYSPTTSNIEGNVDAIITWS